MAFIKIKKNEKTLNIPSGAYKQYARNGWKKVEEKKQAEPTVESYEKDEWDEADEEINTNKSVDEMSMDELKAKAIELKINTKNLNTVGAYRKAIKKALSE